MSSPLISIIVPVYNVESYLCSCLDSITVQTISNFEVILVDDGSTDNSGYICDEYAQRDRRFFVIHKKNEGVAKARITAFEHSHGDLITFIDSDDYVSPEYLEKLSHPIFFGGADMVSCDLTLVEDGETNEPFPKLAGIWEKDSIDDFISNHFFYDNQIQGYGMTVYLWTKMVKRKLVKAALLMGKDMWYAEDQIAVFHMLKNCEKLVLLSDRLYYYVQHQGQVIKKYDYSLWENLISLMEKYEELDTDKIAGDGIRKRTWCHIHITIFEKMFRTSVSRCKFCSHISLMRSHPYMVSFFSPMSIDFNFVEKVIYWLLKLRLFSIVFCVARVRNILQR